MREQFLQSIQDLLNKASVELPLADYIDLLDDIQDDLDARFGATDLDK